MSFDGQTLFNLLPALYRLRDAKLAQAQNLSRGPLEELLSLVAEQLAVLEEDLDQLYDDQFIETCAPWVIPYLGDLIGYRPLRGADPAVDNPRAEVARTISFRRRKGTVLVMEQLARDATGWGAHAVEFFQVLATTQYVNHLRPDNQTAADLRGWEPGTYVNTAFDKLAHTVDVRRIASQRGRYNLSNIGIFLWSLTSYSQTRSPAMPVPGNPTCFRLSPLGKDFPLFHPALGEEEKLTAPSGPGNVPDRLRRRVLCEDLKQAGKGVETSFYGEGKSLVIYLGGQALPPNQIQVCNLAGNDGAWNNLPAAGSAYAAAVDPELGRIALPPGSSASGVAASCHYGFNADLGGGEYPRAATFAAAPDLQVVQVPGDYATIHDALAKIAGHGVVEIADSGIYTESVGLAIVVAANGHVELRAADSCHPTLLLGAELTVTGGASSSCDINGLLVAYAAPAANSALPLALVHLPGVTANQLSRLGLKHCTLAPGWDLGGAVPAPATARPALLVEAEGVAITAQRCIVGGFLVNGQSSASLSDSVVDASERTGLAYAGSADAAGSPPAPGGELVLSGCTVVGRVYASLLRLVSNSIIRAALTKASASWQGPLWAARKQEGCVRFSYLPAGAVLPRQFECVQEASDEPEPLFVSSHYGDPGYAKLFPSTPDAVRRGAEDAGEMGAFHFTRAPQIEADLRARLAEYVPAGLEFGIFYET